jgi:hypothetical protein
MLDELGSNHMAHCECNNAVSFLSPSVSLLRLTQRYCLQGWTKARHRRRGTRGATSCTARECKGIQLG